MFWFTLCVYSRVVYLTSYMYMYVYSLLMRAKKLETVLPRDRWLVWPHHDIFFMYKYMYMYIHNVHFTTIFCVAPCMIAFNAHTKTCIQVSFYMYMYMYMNLLCSSSSSQSVCAHYNRVVHYMRFAVAAYGWKLYAYKNGLRGMASTICNTW